MNNNKERTDEYNHKAVENKWQNYWEENKIFFTDLNNFNKPKKYILSMFPYPSGSGLHVGHVRNYTIADASARFYRMLGFNVLFPIGWDSFGLPSEQYAIETNKHPSSFTYSNIENFKRQLMSLGFSYDWSKEINTSEPNYYSITQWMFGKIFSKNLAQYKNHPVLWCDSLSTVLSNEEVKVIDGKMFSERGNFPVINKNIEQWIIKITDYSEILSIGLEDLDWPVSIKNLQKNWIGFTRGSKISFSVIGKNISLEIFTTRIDAVYGANSLAISFSNDLCEKLVTNNFQKDFLNFKKLWENSPMHGFSSDIDGVFTGSYCINPFNGRKIPIWVTNFVFEGYGTGCLKISPFELDVIKNSNKSDFLTKKEAKQNFDIDYSFSIKFGLPITKIVSFDEKFENYSYVNCEIINGFDNRKKAQEKLISFMSEKGFGSKDKSSHLKDWVFSRQRYWGEPIPIVHLKDGNKYLIPEEKLPLNLPYLDDFTPSNNFYSPLQKLKDWVFFKEDKIEGERDVNVMPQWAGSCWYYIAFLISRMDALGKINYLRPDQKEAKKIVDHWLPVDLYIGGQEHANLHLLYARFWNIFLNEQGIVSQKEPFKKLFCQGMIVSGDGSKMSKSKGNVINPDHCVEEWGADALRLYEMFISPPSQTAYFKISDINPMRKWLVRVYNTFINNEKIVFNENVGKNYKLSFLLSEAIKNYENLKFNVVISKLMEFINFLNSSSQKEFSFFYAKWFLQLLSPLAPHISEEIWENILSKKEKKFYCLSNSYLDFNFNSEINGENSNQEIKIVVKINNKFKKVILVSEKNNSEEKIIDLLRKDYTISVDSSRIKVFFVKGKTINILVN